MVKESLEDAVRRILTPRTSGDLLREINDSKARSRPYVFTFGNID